MLSFDNNGAIIILVRILFVLLVVTAVVFLVNTTIIWLGDDDMSDREGFTHSISTDGFIGDAEFDLSDPVINGLIDRIAAERAARLMAEERARDLREENDRLRRQ